MAYTKTVILLCWIGSGACLYHQQSIQTVKPPAPLPDEAYFGFSITYNDKDHSLIISAPNVNEMGEVYSCNNNFTKCLEMDWSLNKLVNQNISDKHHNWFGATLASIPDGLVACAPRWLYNFHEFPERKYRYSFYEGIFARCYLRSDGLSSMLPELKSEDRNEYCPKITEISNVRTQCGAARIFNTFGWSIASRGNTLLIGGPGTNAGRVILQDAGDKKKPPTLVKKELVTVNSKYNEFNFGYGVAFVNYTKHIRINTKNMFAVGVPYNAGKVRIFTETNSGSLDHARKIESGGQTGSRYGETLCTIRYKNADLLLIGAPSYSSDKNYDRGAVHLVEPFTDKGVVLRRSISGEHDGAMFGSTIVNIGDIDLDNIDDVAISAPYEAGGTGAVYIYSGVTLAGEGTYMQKLTSKKSDTKGFGLALHAFQAEENGCKDLAIGVPLSNRVEVFKCINSVKIQILQPVLPSLQNRKDFKSFSFEICMKVKYPEKTKHIKKKISVSVTLNHDSSPAVTILNNGDRSRTFRYEEILKRGFKKLCRTVNVSTPLEANYDKEIIYQISASDAEVPPAGYDPDYVTLSLRSTLTFDSSFSAAICQPATNCTPNVTVEITHTLTRPYLIGSSKVESLSVLVGNKGNGAVYGACARVRTNGVRVRVEGVRDGMQCESISAHEAVCKRMGYLRDDDWLIKLLIETDELTSDSSDIELSAAIFNHGCNDLSTPLRTNSVRITDFISDLLTVTGIGEPDTTVQLNQAAILNTTTKVKHVYTILNVGVTNWASLKCDIGMIKQSYQNISSVYISDSTESNDCSIQDKGVLNSDTVYSCNVNNLVRKVGSATINVEIYVIGGYEFARDILQNKSLVTTYINVYLNNETSITSTTSTYFMEIKVKIPWWIIVTGCLVGIVIVIIVYIVLLKCGVFERKYRKRLDSLKTGLNNHRQSVIRQSVRQELRNNTDNLCGDGDEQTYANASLL